MHFVTPEVYVLAETTTIPVTPLPPSDTSLDFYDYLRSIGVPDWETDTMIDAEELIEVAGRVCYRSFAPGLNPNVTKVREGNRAYLENIIKSRHGSVLEHANITFLFKHVSRVFTHEAVRHRAGCAYSQESLRYVRLDDIPIVALPSMSDRFRHRLARVATVAEEEMRDFAIEEKIDEQPFDRKKALTSAMRRMAPEGLATSIIWTMNLRAARHVLALRTSKHAEEEIRHVFDIAGRILQARYANIFQDFTRSDDGEWTATYDKI